MSKQKKLSEVHLSFEEKKKIGCVLDLEKKYCDILWELFTSNEFINDLKIIEAEIQGQYDFLQHTWELKNKLKVPAERLVRQYIYKNLAHLVKHIYPSAVSSDIAFITDDAVINLDVKTLDTVGNAGDIHNLQFENNQSSFVNKNLDVVDSLTNSGVRVECLLPKEYSYAGAKPLPMLTFFFTLVYSDNGSSFKINRTLPHKSMYLKCLPNGLTSVLFDFDLVDNFKTYTYLEKKHGLEPVFLTKDTTLVSSKVKEFVDAHPEYVIINGRSRVGAYNSSQEHPKYKTSGVSWYPVPRKDKTNGGNKYFLEAVHKGNTNRLVNSKILERYDSSDNLWYGVKDFQLK